MPRRDGGATRRTAGGANGADRSGWPILWALALGLAAYVGFRMPNRFSTTHYLLSLTGGYHRRFVVGTLLRPLMIWTHDSYTTAAVAAFVILGALLAWIVVASQSAPTRSQRFLALAFLLLPTGGYLFHEVGYLDQLLYLLLFAAVWCLRRQHLALAVSLVVVASCTQEITLITVLPVFAYECFQQRDRRSATVACAIPAVANVALLVLPGATRSAAPRALAEVQRTHFVPNPGVLTLFRQGLLASWHDYSLAQIGAFLVPFAIVLGVMFLAVTVLDRPASRPLRSMPELQDLIGLGAIVIPCGLTFAGWDESRWAFLMMANFVIVVWLRVGHARRELTTAQVVALVIGVLVLLDMPLSYFDGVNPRPLAPGAFRDFVRSLFDGSLFVKPPR